MAGGGWQGGRVVDSGVVGDGRAWKVAERGQLHKVETGRVRE